MKKIILVISSLLPLFVFAQETRILNGQYNDGQTFGKPVPDTVRTLVATSPLSIVSGGASLVDTIKSSGGSGGTPAGSTGYIQYNNGGAFAGSSNLFWDNTNQRLGIGVGGAPSYPLDIRKVANDVERIRITNTSTETSAIAQIDASNGTASFQEGVAGTGYTTTGLISANTVYFQANNASQLLFRMIASAYPNPPIVFAGGSGAGNTEFWRIDNNTGNWSNTGAAGSSYINLKAGTTSEAQIHLTGGVAPTSPSDGDIWYESTNSRLMVRRTVNNYDILTTNSINTVSPTSPNRTITVIVNGQILYIAAKTTND